MPSEPLESVIPGAGEDEPAQGRRTRVAPKRKAAVVVALTIMLILMVVLAWAPKTAFKLTAQAVSFAGESLERVFVQNIHYYARF